MSELVPLLVRADQVERVRRAIARALRPVRGSRGIFVEDRDDSLLILGPPPARAGVGIARAGFVKYEEEE